MKTLFDQTYDGPKETGLSEVLFVKGGVGSVYSEAHFFFVVFPWIAVKGSQQWGTFPFANFTPRDSNLFGSTYR
jgi:hypothetical protein